jgi:hypothetical protein
MAPSFPRVPLGTPGAVPLVLSVPHEARERVSGMK